MNARRTALRFACAALAALALLRPDRGSTTLAWLTALVMMFVLLLGSVGAVPRAPAGPVAAVTVFVLAVALGCLGLREPWLAGTLLLGAGASLAVATVLGAVISGMVHRHGLPISGSSAAVSALTLAVGLLFLLAGAVERRSSGRRSGGVGDALRGGPAGLQTGDGHPER
jgi:hypothetical protein